MIIFHFFTPPVLLFICPNYTTKISFVLGYGYPQLKNQQIFQTLRKKGKIIQKSIHTTDFCSSKIS